MKLTFCTAVRPTTTNKRIARTFVTTKTFSIFEALDTPQLTIRAASVIAIKAMRSKKPPFTPKGLANAFGSCHPSGVIKARKLAESPEAIKAIPIRYSASSAQPEIQPQNSPKITLIHE